MLRISPAARSGELMPALMMPVPCSASPVEPASAVESTATVEPVPAAIITNARRYHEAEDRRTHIENRPGSRRWRRRVIVSWCGRAVRLNHLGAGIRAQSRSEAKREHRQCCNDKNFSHDQLFPSAVSRIKRDNLLEVARKK